jgi:hypothetical protein
MGGAERLLGKGDMLYLPIDAGKPERIQGTILADDELERIVEHWRQTPPRPAAPEQTWEPLPDEDDEPAHEDDLLPQAEQIARDAGKASISMLQRRLGIGYARAGRLIDLLEAHGVIGPELGGGRPREIIAPDLAVPGDPRGSNTLPGANWTRASMTAERSDTMLPGNLKGAMPPGNNFIPPTLPPSGPHAPGHAQAQPGKRDSGITNARDQEDDIEELDW